MLEAHLNNPIFVTTYPDLLAKRFLYNLALAIRRSLKEATPVDTGEAKRSWSIVRRYEKGYSFGNATPYIKYLEVGSVPGYAPWPGVGPKTTMYNGMIFSDQAPGGIVANSGLDQLLDQRLSQLFDMVLK